VVDLDDFGDLAHFDHLAHLDDLAFSPGYYLA
jgi:hypothetical protein